MSSINVLVFKDGDFWCGQCLQYNISAQTESLDGIERELRRLMIGHVVASREVGNEPFEDLPPAPEKYWKMYEEARALQSVDNPYKVADESLSYSMPEPELRLCG